MDNVRVTILPFSGRGKCVNNRQKDCLDDTLRTVLKQQYKQLKTLWSLLAATLRMQIVMSDCGD